MGLSSMGPYEAGSRSEKRHKSKPNLGRYLVAAASIALLAGAGGWAIGATLVGGTGENAQKADQNVWAPATETTIGSALNLGATVKQPVQTVASNHLAGVVTSISPGETKQGDAIYEVAGNGVFAVKGKLPFYRDIGPRTSGADVKQVEAMLKSTGHFTGTPDATYDSITANAIKKWQVATKQKADGNIALGRLVAISALPAEVQLADGIIPGKQLAGGEDAVMAPSGERTFSMALTAEQAALIPQDSAIELEHGKTSWKAVIAQTTTAEGGGINHILTAPAGGPVCGETCTELPSGSSVTLRAKVIVVPATTGIGIPAAAITTDPMGQANVTTEAGTTPVTVVASGKGISIVEGLEAGTKVKVIGAPLETPATPEAP